MNIIRRLLTPIIARAVADAWTDPDFQRQVIKVVVEAEARRIVPKLWDSRIATGAFVGRAPTGPHH